MSTNTTTSAPAADAGGAPNAPQEGATPPAEQPTTTESKPLTEAEARTLLRKHSQPSRDNERDPLDGEAEQDPLLTHSEDAERDPLGEAIECAEEESEAEPNQTAPDGETPGSTEGTAAAEEVPAKPETEAEADAPEQPEADGPRGRKRLNIFRKNDQGEYVYNAQERAAMQFADEEGVGFIEAWHRLFGDMPKAETATATNETKPVEQPKELTVEEITSQIATLRAQRKEAAKNLDGEKSNELTEQIEDLLEQKNAAQQRDAERGRAQQTAAQQHEVAQRASMDRAGKMYPDAVKDGTALHGALIVEIGKIERSNPAFFRDPEWPEMLSAKLAGKLGIAPLLEKPAAVAPAPAKTAAPAAQAAPAKPVAPKQAARPAPAPGGVSPAPRQQTTADFQARLQAARERNDIPAVRALMREAQKMRAS